MITTQIDLFICNNPMWLAKLSNGSVVYQDDDRPGEIEPSAWIRLQEYLIENNLTIIGLGLRFKTNQFWLPENKDGYFFCKVAGADWCGPTINYYNIGFLEDGVVHTTQYKVPELTYFNEGTRSPEKCFPGTLIINGKTPD